MLISADILLGRADIPDIFFFFFFFCIADISFFFFCFFFCFLFCLVSTRCLGLAYVADKIHSPRPVPAEHSTGVCTILPLPLPLFSAARYMISHLFFCKKKRYMTDLMFFDKNMKCPILEQNRPSDKDR